MSEHIITDDKMAMDIVNAIKDTVEFRQINANHLGGFPLDLMYEGSSVVNNPFTFVGELKAKNITLEHIVQTLCELGHYTIAGKIKRLIPQ